MDLLRYDLLEPSTPTSLTMSCTSQPRQVADTGKMFCILRSAIAPSTCARPKEFKMGQEKATQSTTRHHENPAASALPSGDPSPSIPPPIPPQHQYPSRPSLLIYKHTTASQLPQPQFPRHTQLTLQHLRTAIHIHPHLWTVVMAVATTVIPPHTPHRRLRRPIHPPSSR